MSDGAQTDQVLLTIRDLCVSFDTDDGQVNAVEHVSLDVYRGEVLGLVGESGCGKSVTALSTMRLIPSPPGRILSGQVMLDGQDLLTMPLNDLRKVRGARIGMIFQEPMTALSPLHRVGRQLVETLQLHRNISRSDAWALSVEWLSKVGIPDAAERMYAYPFQLSGGMRQRVMIAMVLMLDPDLVIADEPTTALDVTVQAQIFDLMRAMKKKDTALVLITHDMGVVWEMCTRVAVMYASEIVETGEVHDIYDRPQHPYTAALLASLPVNAKHQSRLQTIAGQVPSPLDYPAGCRFCDRCEHAFDRCRTEHPPVYVHGDRLVRCFLREKELQS